MTSGMRLFATVLLFGVLSAGQVEHTLAHLGIVWRLALLSWDSPTTQWHDELASQSVLCADPARDASESVRRTPSVKGTLVVVSDPDRLTVDIAPTPPRSPPSR
jgi:hypothetical protein